MSASDRPEPGSPADWLRYAHSDLVLAETPPPTGVLGLDVARDAVTTDAMSRALTKLADVPVERLAGGRLEAEDFNALLAPNPDRDLLRWLDDPEWFQEAQGPQHWAAFGEVCRERFGLDPEKAGPLAAAQRLGKGEGAWSDVWLRFTEAPHRYPKLPERLGQAKPEGTTGDLFGGVSEAWPQDNDQEENELRAALSAVKEKDDLQAVQAAALALYRPWLEQQATTFASVLGSGLPPQPDAAAIKPQGGCVWLFVETNCSNIMRWSASCIASASRRTQNALC